MDCAEYFLQIPLSFVIVTNKPVTFSTTATLPINGCLFETFQLSISYMTYLPHTNITHSSQHCVLLLPQDEYFLVYKKKTGAFTKQS